MAKRDKELENKFAWNEGDIVVESQGDPQAPVILPGDDEEPVVKQKKPSKKELERFKFKPKTDVKDVIEPAERMLTDDEITALFAADSGDDDEE